MFKIIIFYQQLLLVLYLPLIAFYTAYITIKIYRQQIDNGILLVYTSLPLSKTRISFYKILGLISFLIVINLFLLVISGFFAVINGKNYFNALMLDVIKTWPLISIFLCAFASLVFLISVWYGSKLTILLSSIFVFICTVSIVILPMLQAVKESQHPYYNFSQDEKFKNDLNKSNLSSNFIGKDLFNIEDIKYLYHNGVLNDQPNPNLLDDSNTFTFSLYDRSTKSNVDLNTQFNKTSDISVNSQTLIDILKTPSSTKSTIFKK
ncbi:hypothetical protein [Spiroplasma endosymbiont of Virgichneumon dumeticola]|uniref:hypothetical protein n=1 Tax=Spiroplasma endosymbiont of Virgichneumon dumeticola TaxID=3139323 RepID=UPI0035C90EC2